jgi:PAS domain S-box-containing protein
MKTEYKSLIEKCSQLEQSLKKAKEEIEYYKNIATETGKIRLREVDQLSMLITEHKHVEKALRESQDLLRATIESTADGILVVDEKGQVTHANKRFAQMWQIPDELIQTKDDGKLLDFVLDQLNDPEAFLLKVKTLYKTPDEDFDVIDFKDGRVFERFSCPLIREGQIAGRVWSFRDITDRKIAEEEKTKLQSQLQQAQKMESIGTLAGGIAHDFNNILGIIIGNAELGMEDVPEWNPAKLNLKQIRDASLRAKDVVSQLLSFARKTKLEKTSTDIVPIIKKFLQLLRSSIPTSIEIRQNIHQNVDTIRANPTQINQILINLCNNAHYAMPDGGILEISIKNIELDEDASAHYPELNPGRFVTLAISDTGHGISQDEIDRIFDPYFTTKDVGEGSGMGLAVVHGIVKEHNGIITVKSELGKGTTFSIFFPTVEGEVAEATKTDEDLPAGRESILLIDDEEPLLQLGCRRLERLGYKVEAQIDPLDALKLFRSNPDQFDLVITDMTMPRMTGDQLLKEILKIRSDIPTMLCTGFSEKIDEERAKKIGIRQYVEKPINRSDLAKFVRKVLDEK